MFHFNDFSHDKKFLNMFNGEDLKKNIDFYAFNFTWKDMSEIQLMIKEKLEL